MDRYTIYIVKYLCYIVSAKSTNFKSFIIFNELITQGKNAQHWYFMFHEKSQKGEKKYVLFRVVYASKKG